MQNDCSIDNKRGTAAVLVLTDVVVLLAHVELVAERERAVPLELLGELDWCVGRVGAVTLPPLEAKLGVAGAVATVTDHVEDVLFPGAHHALAVVVVGAVDVQIVVHVHLHGVALPTQAGRGGERILVRIDLEITTVFENVERLHSELHIHTHTHTYTHLHTDTHTLYQLTAGTTESSSDVPPTVPELLAC